MIKGNRKFYGFAIASGVLVVGLIAGAWADLDVEILKTYFLAVIVISGGFFGFNGLEHWTDKKNGS